MIKKIILLTSTLWMMSLHAQNKTDVTENETTESETIQSYKLSVNKGKLKIDLGRTTIEGYDGKEIIFSKKQTSKKVDERAKGLRAINANGLDDNTGLGINVVEKNGIVEVVQLNRITPPNISIKVPKAMLIYFDHQSQFGSTVTLRNLENEIEVSTSYNSIVLENVTGPATVNSIYGNIDAKFSQNVKGPLSVVSIYGRVDVTIPKTVKANVKASTSYGEILVAPELPLKMESKSGMIRYNDQLNATLNEGGTGFTFRSDYGKIYLRAL
ncbi:DUF4097 family beta strand repeat-containing protein [Empedobacter tilapiae]|uniref:DUF4097 family beta strand repeat-containing protein n=1 Tax=Empedobacter tilapiae TaxID=2491114 RepID=UPI0028D5BDE6|nr:DUF4097 family beta strand repeat-containing protein [Empedobacter tilapiae]